jgi:O-antigen/teichoic acid export membrane protein
MMDSKERSLKYLAKGAGLIFFGLILSKIFTYLFRIIIARVGPAEYGLFSLGIAVFSLFTVVARFGMGNGILRFVSYYRSKNQKEDLMGTIFSVLSFEFFISIIFAVAGFLLAEFIAVSIFHNPELTQVIKILMFAIPFSVFVTMFINTTKAFEKAQYEVISRNFIENLVKLGLTILLIYLGLGVIGAVYASVVAIFVSFIFALFFFLKVLKNYKWEWGFQGKFREVFYYSWPLLLSSLMIFIYTWTDTFMIGYLMDVSSVGIYNAVIPTASLLNLISMGLMTLFIPVITNLYIKKEKETFKSVFQSVSKWIFFVNAIILAILMFFGREVLAIIFGDVYAIGYWALFVLSVAYLAYALTNSSYNILLIHKKTKFLFVVTLFTVLLNLVLNYFFIQYWGIVGGAISTLIANLLFSVLLIYKSYSLTSVFPFKLNNLTILLIAFFSVFIGYLVRGVFVGSIFWTLVLFLILGIIYFLILIFVRAFDKNDLVIVDSIKNKIGLKSVNFKKILRIK